MRPPPGPVDRATRGRQGVAESADHPDAEHPAVDAMGVVREAPTFGELAEAAYRRPPPQEAARLLAAAQPARAGPRPDPGTAPPPHYTSFAAWLADTIDRDRRVSCARRARTANRDRLMSGPPAERITGADVMGRAGGRPRPMCAL
jgi:hypothetical protein